MLASPNMRQHSESPRLFYAITNEAELAAVATALAGPSAVLTESEGVLSEGTGVPAPDLLKAIEDQMLDGLDPLGDVFTGLRSAAIRRRSGATYTPKPIIDSMVAWAVGEGSPGRIVDPGAGSGRFILAAARRFPEARLVAVDIDPLATLMLRANARVAGIDRRLEIKLDDYRRIALPEIDAKTLFIGNPPYVRHHDISTEWKTWYAHAAEEHGVAASKLAGLHLHFFLRTLQLAAPGDYGCFVTSAEWLDVNYGVSLRRLLAGGLGGVSLHVLTPTTLPFEGTSTTGAITTFRIANRPTNLTVLKADSLVALGDLRAGRTISWSDVQKSSRWSELLQPVRRRAVGHIDLGELFRVHRGQVTGSNRVWILGAYPGRLPTSYLYPTVTRARELIAAAPELTRAEHLRLVLDLPTNLGLLNDDELEQVERFLKWAVDEHADKGYIARHRRAWWSVGLREPAPILATYMARRAPAFVLNRSRARHINIAHGLYPRQPLTESELESVVTWLSHHTTVDQGRTYAGGLTKFEPKELERLSLPPLEELNDRATTLVTSGSGTRRHDSHDLVS